MFEVTLFNIQPTVLQLPPPLISFLADSPAIKPHHLASLRYVMVGAAPVGPALEQRFKKKAPGDKFWNLLPDHFTHFQEYPSERVGE